MADGWYVNKNQLMELPNGNDWGALHLWDVQFPTAPAPFDEWFPATDIEENVFTLETEALEFYMSTFELPKSTTLFDLKITYIDDIHRTLLFWVANWINSEILNGDKGGLGGYRISPIRECCKPVNIMRLNKQKEMIGQATYWVFPKGAGYFNGSSEPEPATNELEMVIAGTPSTSGSQFYSR